MYQRRAVESWELHTNRDGQPHKGDNEVGIDLVMILYIFCGLFPGVGLTFGCLVQL